MKIATWNVNSLRVRLKPVLSWLSEYQPDVLALQETKTQDADFPLEVIEKTGYQVIFSGQKSYNGVAVFSRQAIEGAPLVEWPHYPDPARRILGVTIAGIRILNLYVPNGASVDSDKYVYKLEWFEALKRHIQSEQARYEKIIILGDFNIAPEDRDVYDPKAWKGHVLVSPKERATFHDLLQLGFQDSLRLQHPKRENLFTWWDYRQARFRAERGLRIDHILISETLKPHLQACEVDIHPREQERPSDHAPVYAVLDLPS